MNNLRQKQFKQALKNVEKYKDKLGKKVDPNIKELVALLNLFGIQTIQSCQGHMSHGTFAPYIDFEDKAIPELWTKRKNIREKLGTNIPDSPAMERLGHKMEVLNFKNSKKLFKLLFEFYQNHEADFENRLTIDPWGFARVRLEPQGRFLQKMEKSKIKKTKRLKNFQFEMSEFSQFLSSKFFKS